MEKCRTPCISDNCTIGLVAMECRATRINDLWYILRYGADGIINANGPIDSVNQECMGVEDEKKRATGAEREKRAVA